jgi:hypothetical protein
MSLIRFSHFFFFLFFHSTWNRNSHIIIVTRLFIVLQKQKIFQFFFEFCILLRVKLLLTSSMSRACVRIKFYINDMKNGLNKRVIWDDKFKILFKNFDWWNISQVFSGYLNFSFPSHFLLRFFTWRNIKLELNII